MSGENLVRKVFITIIMFQATPVFSGLLCALYCHVSVDFAAYLNHHEHFCRNCGDIYSALLALTIIYV